MLHMTFTLIPIKLYACLSVYSVQKDIYPNVPKFLDRQVWANSVDPDQTAPRGAV